VVNLIAQTSELPAPFRDEPAGASMADDRVPFRQWLAAVRQRKLLTLFISLLLFALGGVVIVLIPSAYTAESVIMIDTRRAPLGDFQTSMPEIQAGAEAVRSAVEVIRSNRVADLVVGRLDLASNPRFDGSEQSAVGRAVSAVLSALPIPLPSSQDDVPAGPDLARSTAVATLLRGLDVSTDGRSYIVKIRYSDRDPTMASAIVNAVAQAYIDEQIALKDRLANRVNSWLGQQIADLRNAVRNSDQAVETYKAQHGLSETRGSTLTSQQLAELNSALVVASSDRAAKDSYLDEIRGLQKVGGLGAEGSVLASPLIQRLREQEAEVARREEELKSVYLPEHPALKRLAAEHAGILAKIRQAVDKLATNAETEAKSARAKEAALRSRVRELETAAAQNDQKSIQLRDLEREAEANQSLLHSMLDRVKEVDAQRNFVMADARLVAPAPVPMRPSFPQRSLLLAVCAVFAAMAGVASAILLEWRRPGFRTEDELQSEGRISTYGLIPAIPRGRRRPIDLMRGPTIETEPFNFVRSLLPAGRYRRDGSAAPKVILVTSAVPGEGKTFFASSLALSLANANQRCLLLDCDLRKPSVAHAFDLNRRRGEFDVIDGPISPLGQTLGDRVSGLHFVPAVKPAPDPRTVIESASFAKYIDKVRGLYDVVIIDAPPVYPVADALHLSLIADGTLFVVRWDKTPRSVVRSALNTLHAAGGQVLGAVLTNVDLRRHAKYGVADRAFCYARYKKAYAVRA
jgi:capsular exopolysaccharide synthesis family protein